MLRPVSTLPLAKRYTSELSKSSCFYLQDIENLHDWAHLNSDNALNFLPLTVSALDLCKEELQKQYVTTFCDDLDNILDGGIECGAITEITGAPGSGKTQLCLQLCVSAQLSEKCGGLNSESLYIDMRNGFSPTRVQDLIRGCSKRFPNSRIHEKEILDGIKVSIPTNLEDLLLTIHNLQNHLRTDSKIRLVIVDSLTILVQSTYGDGWQRTQFYFRIIDELQKIVERHNVAVVIVNERCAHIDAKGVIIFESAAGRIFAHRVQKRLLFTRLSDTTFAAKILKSTTNPQISVPFRVTEDGIRDSSS